MHMQMNRFIQKLGFRAEVLNLFYLVYPLPNENTNLPKFFNVCFFPAKKIQEFQGFFV